MKNFCLLLCLCCTMLCYTQQISPPNYTKIKQKVSTAASPLYYPKIFKKFKAADSTMTLVEKRHVYYGFIHQKKYSPYSRSDYVDSLNIVLKIKQLEEKEFRKIIRYSDSLLVDNPFNLNAYNYKSYAYGRLKKEALGMKVFIQKKIIIDAMLSSGDGLTKKTPFYVIASGHQHFIMQLLDVKFNGSQSVIDDFEYFSVEENDKDIAGLFFDVSAISNHMSNLFKNEP